MYLVVSKRLVVLVTLISVEDSSIDFMKASLWSCVSFSIQKLLIFLCSTNLWLTVNGDMMRTSLLPIVTLEPLTLST